MRRQREDGKDWLVKQVEQLEEKFGQKTKDDDKLFKDRGLKVFESTHKTFRREQSEMSLEYTTTK